MDPFVVISFGKKVFRTRVIRHSLNPIWNEKLLFHVRRYETNFNVQLVVLDWDKLTSNDYVGEVQFNVSELLDDIPKKDDTTGLYDENELERGRVARGKEFSLRLKTEKEVAWDTKHSPILSFR
jgi:phosphatidylserine decarboxylase